MLLGVKSCSVRKVWFSFWVAGAWFCSIGESGLLSKQPWVSDMQITNHIHFQNLRADIPGEVTVATVSLLLALAFGVASGAGAIAWIRQDEASLIERSQTLPTSSDSSTGANG